MNKLVPATLCFVVLLGGCVEPQPSAVITPRALGYFEENQNQDGGFGGAPNTTSDFATSAWVALAAAAADTHAPWVDRLGTYITAEAPAVLNGTSGGLSRVNPLSLLVLSSIALDLPAETRANASEQLRGYVDNETIWIGEQMFLLGALSHDGHAADADPVAARILAKLQDPQDAELAKSCWSRSYAVLSLLAHGADAQGADMRGAARSLLPFQKEDKGFRESLELEPDASTTAAVVTVLGEVRFVYSHEHEAGLGFIQELQQPSGAVRFSAEFDFSPVKTTAEAVLAASGHSAFDA